MNPDVLAALPRLRSEGVLDERTERVLARVYGRELVSVRNEIRALVSLAILLVTTGVGFLVKENLRAIGPLGIAAALTLASAACLFVVARRAPEFSWGEVPSSGIGFDALLLLGVLLFGADLGFVEAQFHLLKEAWPYHLLILSVFQLAAAYRFDSRPVLSLSLATFAAWRGLSGNAALRSIFGSESEVLRANALACGALFLVVAAASRRFERKAHFEMVWGNLGLFLFFAGLLSGVFESSDRSGVGWIAWELVLACAAAIAIAYGLKRRRPSYFAQGAIAAYLGALRVIFEVLPDTVAMLFVSVSSLAMLVFVAMKWRSLREDA
ncbi:MAG: DUF2157 domain-containing protein [Thermoanaerobaculia bacterium]